MKIFYCLTCGTMIEEAIAGIAGVKKGWHKCPKDGWVKDEQVTEFVREEDTTDPIKRVGNPLPYSWLNEK